MEGERRWWREMRGGFGEGGEEEEVGHSHPNIRKCPSAYKQHVVACTASVHVARAAPQLNAG